MIMGPIYCGNFDFLSGPLLCWVKMFLRDDECMANVL